MKKIVLTAALILATASAAMAFEFDPNLANRYPAYANPAATHGTFQSAPVRLQSRNVALPTGRIGSPAPQSDPYEIDRSDRASSPYAGGGF